MEDIDQGVVTDSHVEGSTVLERREPFTTYVNSLVQQPPRVDNSLHSLMEGSINVPDETKYGPNAPFWITYMGQSIVEFGVTRPSFQNPPPGDHEYRRVQASLDCTRSFQERMERVMATPIPHKEPMSALLPCLSNPWNSGYRSLFETLDPIDDVPPRGMSPHNPGQTSNPKFLNPRSVSSPPITSLAWGKSSSQMVLVHSNIGWKPPVQATLSFTGFSTSTRHTSIVGQPTVVVPPTHANMVNP